MCLDEVGCDERGADLRCLGDVVHRDHQLQPLDGDYHCGEVLGLVGKDRLCLPAGPQLNFGITHKAMGVRKDLNHSTETIFTWSQL